MRLFKNLFLFAALISAFGLMSACGTNGTTTSESAAEKPALAIYEVHHDGRIHVFYDKKLYQEFLSLGETPFRFTKIGAGPNGETLVFGLTKHDKKMKKPVQAIELYEGKVKPDAFYAEMRKHGRIYIFDNFEDMNPVRMFGHPNFMYTQIGAGPKGETIVFVLNKKNKKKRPDALIAEYKKRNS